MPGANHRAVPPGARPERQGPLGSSEGGSAPLPKPPPGRSASRRTSRGWSPAVRGEQSETCAGKPALEAEHSRAREQGNYLHSRLLDGPETAARSVRPWLTAALDLLFPPFCPVCQAPLGVGRRDPLCGICWQGLERLAPPWCRRCGVALSIEGLCGECRTRRRPFSYARAAVRYGPIAREALHAFKFSGRRALAAPLAELLAELGLG